MGFNIEIKYPDTTELEQYYDIQQRNFYVDTILNCCFNFVGKRSCIISSFDPDICVMCARKQLRFPVFFLTTGGFDETHQDSRRNSVESAVTFAKSAKLLGIVCDSRPILENPVLITLCHQNSLLLFTYGSENNDPKKAKFQKKLGVDAIIADNIVKIKKKNCE